MREIIHNGNALPIHFGMRALSSFARSAGWDFKDTLDPTKVFARLETIISLTPHALNDGARKNGNSARYTEDDVWDMIDANPALMEEIATIFMESVTPIMGKLGGMKPTDQSAEGDESKKKRVSQ